METLQRNPDLWKKAKARAKFQSHLVVFLAVNAGLWVIWALTHLPHSRHQELPWPLWVSAFWGFGLVLRGISTYGSFGHEQRTQREYERLVRGQGTDSLDRYR